MANLGQAVVGIIVLLVVIAGLLYVFYSRTNAVEKTGYGALAMLALVSLMIPVFWIVEGNNHAEAQTRLFSTAVERGQALYAQYCTDKCYGIKDDKVINPKYNGYTIEEINKLSDDDITRIISAGVYNPNAPAPVSLSAIPKSDLYGGALLSNDIDYLRSFIRSADPGYLKLHGYAGQANGFTTLPAYLQANASSQYNAAVSYGATGQFGEAKDLTSQKTVSLDMVNPGDKGVTCDSKTSCFTPINIKVKVGTVITWTNHSSQPHTVTAIVGQDTATHKDAPQIFDSSKGDSSNLVKTNDTFTYTVTQEAYTFNPDHTVIYYCRIHPDMLAQLTIVP
ncbi:cupredoxin domain-containing protein [Tengunoibacter tsumagoiensis]|uniref:Blue (type 1) copper domain-containing protein n=1 Tax=Tengunoibacter tsumagoiensis TaxID=2014871 RepID=A0A401ZZK9_9CHLR|nr:plastocyanin/azurin family copper-binding protein [Tengunoibacter tsumagoiensis]GCE12300.1 hypothetical protein KTT_21590 [Tengunoibacter tsumagoiensis]